MPPSRETEVKRTVLFLMTVFFAATAAAKEGQLSSSLSRLLRSEQSLVCTFETEAGSSTAYTAKGKMRGDFGTTHVIHDREWRYVWGGLLGEKKGLKVSASQTGALLPGGDKVGPDMDETVRFDCRPWQPDTSKFQPPLGVDFQEVAPPLERVPDAVADKNARCAACDQAPEGSSRQECRQSLGCA